MKIQRVITGWSLAMILLVLAGCSGMLTKPERPEVSVVGITLVESGLLQQRFRVELRVQNPNNFDLPIDGMQMQLDLNGKKFVTAVSGKSVTVPRFGSALMEIDAVSTLSGLLGQLNDIASGKIVSVSYKLTGSAHLSRPSMNLPFIEEGAIDLSGLAGQMGR